VIHGEQEKDSKIKHWKSESFNSPGQIPCYGKGSPNLSRPASRKATLCSAIKSEACSISVSRNIAPGQSEPILIGGANLLKPALQLMNVYRLRIDEIKGNAVVTSYTRWLEAVIVKGTENQEVYVTFSPLFERIWVESKKRLPEYVAREPGNIGLRSQYSIRLYAWAKKYASVRKKRICLEELRKVLGLELVRDATGSVIQEPPLPVWANFRQRALGTAIGPERPPIVFYAFDLLQLNSKDLHNLPIEERKAKLEELLKKPPGVLRYLASFTRDIPELLNRARNLGLEGLIGKRAGSRYEAGKRSGAWIKIKLHLEQEFIIGGYTEPEGSRKYFGALLVGFYKGKKLKFAGRVGTGFSEKLLSTLFFGVKQNSD
jgi:hypothetical protein